MITPSFSSTATERVLPKLALDFTTASLDSRITFTRTTGASNPATYVSSSGLITSATNNQPRFDYDPVTLSCKGLLIEESRANLCSYSDDFSNAFWSKLRLSVSSNVATAPDGTTTADKLVEDTATGGRNVNAVLVPTAAATTFTAYLKAGERTWGALRLYNASSYFAYFNLSTGVVGSVTAGATSSISNAGNGWYRCSITLTTAASDCIPSIFIALSDGVFSYTGDGTSGIYAWGAQVETGAFPTSYIPTTTTALTRNADVATMTGTNFSDWFNTTANTFFAQWSSFSAGSGTNPMVFTVSDGTTNNLAQLYVNNSTTIIWNVRSGAADSCSLISAASTAGTTYKASMTSAANSFAASLNSLAPSTDNTGAVPVSPDRMGLGNRAGSLFLNGYLQKLSVYPQRLINAELQATSK